MIKVSDIIQSLDKEFPGYRMRSAVRKVMLPHYGYSRWSRNVTVAHANAMMNDARAAMRLERIEQMFRDAMAEESSSV